MTRYKLKNGKRVPFTPAEEARRDEEEAKAAIKIRKRERQEYRRKREREFDSIGDQVDAIIQTFRYLRKSWIDIGPAGDKLLRRSKEVKDKYPKPEEEI